jgi:hypothetical protein
VLSYREDLTNLESLNYKNIYKTIIIENYLDRKYIDDILNKSIEEQGIITLKKYIALDILKDKYEYLCTVDSESEFVSTNSVYEKLKKYCDRKIIIGSTVDSTRNVTNSFFLMSQNELVKVVEKINNESILLFNGEDIEEINSKINNRFYFWYSDIPVYDSKILIDFFNHIKFNSDSYIEFSKRLNYYIFDYISYAYYCILYKDYNIMDIKEYGVSRNWSLESMPYDTYQEILNIGYKPMSLIYNTYIENKSKIDDIILIYHKNDGRYVYL